MLNRTPRFISLFSLCLLLPGLLLCLGACRPKDGGLTEEALDPLSIQQLADLEKKAGPLVVEFYSPKGEIEQAPGVVVSFNQPMVGLKEIEGDVANPPFTLSPRVPGRYRWLGTKTLGFYPDQPFPKATHFEVVVARTTQSLFGKPLNQELRWTFETPRPIVINSNPSAALQIASTKQPIVLTFNQPMDPATVATYATLTLEGGATPQKLAFTVRYPTREESAPDEPDQSQLVFVPEAPLPLDTNVNLVLSNRVTGRSGPLAMAGQFELQFKTHGPFKISGIDCGQLCPPHDAINFAVTTPIDQEEFLKHLRFEPSIPALNYAYWNSKNSVMTIYPYLAGDTAYQAIVSGELTDQFGQKLGQEVRLPLKTVDLPPRLDFRTGFGVLERDGRQEIYVRTMNVEAIDLQAALLTEEQVVAANESGNLYSGDDDLISDYTVTLTENRSPAATKNKHVVTPFVLKPALKKAESGFMLVDITSPQVMGVNYQTKQPYLYHHRSLVQVTNMGITGKWSPENSVFWVSTLSSGVPVKGARLSIRGPTGKLLWLGFTDEQGVAKGPGLIELNTKGVSEGDEVDPYAYNNYYVFAVRDRDTAMSMSSWSDGFSSWDFGVAEEWEVGAERWRAHLFTERGAYRPGETVHVKGIVRQETSGALAIPQGGGKVVVRIEDETIHEEKITLSEHGSFNFDVPLSAQARTGYYSIVFQPEDETIPVRGSGEFQVQWYRVPEFKVEGRAISQNSILGESIKALFEGRYLFGAPMQGRDGAWDLTKSSTYFVPEGDHEGYSWGRAYEERFQEGVSSSYQYLADAQFKLNDLGQYEISYQTEDNETLDPESYSFRTTVYDVNRQAQHAETSVTVHPAAFYLGLKPTSHFAEAGQPLNVAVMGQTVAGKPVTKAPVQLKWNRVVWHTVKQAGFGREFKTVYERKKELVQDCEISQLPKDQACAVTPSESGYYLVEAESEDDQGRSVQSSVGVYVHGGGYGAWKWEDHDRLTIVPDKKNYQPGDVAHLLVQNPFPGAEALITYERNGVIKHERVTLAESTPLINVPITEDQAPNFFVGLVLVRGRINSDNGSLTEEEAERLDPAIRVGLVELPVEAEGYRLQAVVKTDRTDYRPGDPVGVDVEIRDHAGVALPNAEVTLMVVDVGVLQMTGYATPDPFSRFYESYGLAVTTTDSRIHLIGQRDYGAKMNQEASGGGQSPSWRSKFVPSAYWNPAILTDEQGRAHVKFNLPDNLTKFRVMAVAHHGTARFGSAETEFLTNKEVMLTPSMPRFSRIGDRFKAGVVVHNQSDSSLSVSVQANGDGVEFLKGDSDTITVGRGEGRELLFDLRALEAEQASLSFEGRVSGNSVDAVRFTIPLHYPLSIDTVAVSGNTDEWAQELIQKPDAVFLDKGGLSFSLASTQLVGLEGALDKLYRYPFGCLEQRVSQVYPLLFMRKLIEDFGWSEERLKGYDARLNRFLEEIAEEQNYTGGFKFWRDSWVDSPYLTAYVGGFLAQAQQAGYAISPTVITRTKEYLYKFLRRQLYDQQIIDNEIDIMALDALRMLGEDIDSYAEMIALEIPRLEVSFLMMAIDLLHRIDPSHPEIDKTLTALENHLRVSQETAYFEEDDTERWAVYLTSSETTTAQILTTLLNVRPEHPLIPKLGQYLIDALRRPQAQQNWIDTHAVIAAFKALKAYYERYEGDEPRFRAMVQRGGDSFFQARFFGRSFKVESKTLPINQMQDEEKVVFRKEGSGRLYYRAQLDYAKQKDQGLPIEQGMAIQKTYESEQGKPLANTLPPRQVLKVKLRLAVLGDAHHLVVVDPLPAGLEAVNPNLSGNSYLYAQRAAANGVSASWPLSQLVTNFDIRDDEVRLFADYVPAGVYEFTYFVRATTLGDFMQPPTQAGEMYHPETYGRTRAKRVRVE